MEVDEATNEASLDHKIPLKPQRGYVDESVYRAIGTRLSLRKHYRENWTKHSKYWNRDHVRLYILLRMLGFQDGDHVFKRFEREMVDDFWLPLNNAILKKIKSDSLPEFNELEFAKAQSCVMSDPQQMDEQNLVRPFFARQYEQDKQRSLPRHRYIEHGIDFFTDEGQIGVGGSADVKRFRHEASGKEFACKRLPRKTNPKLKDLKDQRNQLESFKKEIDALKELQYHRHIVSLVASFTELESFSLILDPIADQVLLDLLKRTEPLLQQDVATLYNSFNCLATALEFLHAKNIRHKDIKPSNILLGNGRVLLCDFGISHKWTDSENGTTEGVTSFTHRYAAPEVLRWDASRNSTTDIWSLGCVFLEIISVVKGFSFNHIMKDHGLSYGSVEEHEMATWSQKINVAADDTLNKLPMIWVLKMVGCSIHTDA
ncbi:hypothetical protein SLS60_006500 [Paraconiothyrium brasiliense]|uniref:Protein kinase domain-containing protein n=1 Tax=Paraconiothyrium brasiliense TaxID=300254 RepID=A0ABR3RAX2_9PLEO